MTRALVSGVGGELARVAVSVQGFQLKIGRG